jgi:hypothetical protein
MQNKINIENYEAYLLDHLEGTISMEDLLELQVFATQNPHLNIDLNDLELVELSTDEINFENKESLKRVGISDEKFVAYIENELSREEKQNIDALCAKDEKLAKDLRIFKHTLLITDTNIVFEDKNKLKKQETKVLWLFSREVLSMAASLILIMGLWFMFRDFIPGNETLNSQKINGTGKMNSVALKTSETLPVSTVDTNEQVKQDNIGSTTNSNPVAYSKNKPEKISAPKENQELMANTTPTGSVHNDPKNIGNETINKKEENNLEKEAAKYASNNSTDTKAQAAKPYVIIEKSYDEDEKQLAANEKPGFWKKAMKALNGLNKLGVKRVNGTESAQSQNEQYLLSMGNLQIQNNRYNAE